MEEDYLARRERECDLNIESTCQLKQACGRLDTQMGTKREQSTRVKVVKALHNIKTSNVNLGKTYLVTSMYL